MLTSRVSLSTRRTRVAVLTMVMIAWATSVSAQRSQAQRELSEIESSSNKLMSEPLQRTNIHSSTFVEERLTDGELFYRLKDYTRASIIFTDIVEHYPNHRAFPDALYLLADSLYLANDQVGAKNRFEQILQQATVNGSYRSYVQRSLSRLIEIAIRSRNFSSVDQYFAQLSQLPPAEVEAATTYYRGKYLFNRAAPLDDILRNRKPGTPEPAVDTATLDQARQIFEGVQEGSPFYPQARYFVAVVYTLRGEYPQAIEAFRRVLRSPATTTEQMKVAELAQLGLGRLYYQVDELDHAVEAYQAISRTSQYFDLALYEVAWVFIRIGDATRAERALELLSIASPDSRYIADAELLRGNLLLRGGRYDVADDVFKKVRKRFGPIHRELEAMIVDHDNPQLYFQELVRENMDHFDPNAFLPEQARAWAPNDDDMDRAMSSMNDLSASKRLVEEVTSLIERLSTAISAPNRVGIFPDLRQQRERSVALRNRLALLRSDLMSEQSKSSGNAELDALRAKRRAIEASLGRMPSKDDDFAIRDEQLLSRYRDLEKELSHLSVELLGMDARVVATERFIASQASTDVTVKTNTDLQAEKALVDGFQVQIDETKRLIELSRIQVGVGDARYQRDDGLRNEYNALVEQERQLMAKLGMARDSELDEIFARVARVEAQLGQRDVAVDAIVDERTAEMKRVVDEESGKVTGYRDSIASLSTQSEEVVGGVAYASFDAVRHRFYDLVLRSDVGRIDVAWGTREEHRMRVDNLTRERASQMQAIDDEYREIMDMSRANEVGGDEQ